MITIIFGTVLAAQFCFVFLKAIQQRNVIHNNHVAVFPTSLVMAFFEVYVYGMIAKTYITSGIHATLYIALAMGIGGGAGANVGMWLHNKWLKRGDT